MAPIKIKPFILPKLLTLAFCLAILGLAVWYLSFQARFLISGPQLQLLEEPSTEQADRIVTLKGAASNITELYLNGRPIVTNEDGQFEETVVLENGYSVFRIDAVDRYGRTTYLERPFVYQEESLVNQT